MTPAGHGEANMDLALRGLELKTLDPYLAGWRKRVVPALDHLAVRLITSGVVDRTVQDWIADEHSRSTVKNTIAVLVRVMEQAVRDGIITDNPARVTGWQKLYKQTEDEFRDPRALALPDWDSLVRPADAFVAAFHDHYRGWGEVVVFAACAAARIGEVSGCHVQDTRPVDPGRAAKVPIIEEIRPPSPSASCPPAPTPTPACSPARAADASPPPSCATPPTGTTSSSGSATNTCAATTSGTPA
ncbi:hypothetical protein [Streptomyces sp. NPDC049590]|uniref:hypothetical protein n=1 Tax=Streptomyces sp. NPDC049590 TaxID=3154834 RepID=UPI00343D21D2